jgi:hypothetical protein
MESLDTGDDKRDERSRYSQNVNDLKNTHLLTPFKVVDVRLFLSS